MGSSCNENGPWEILLEHELPADFNQHHYTLYFEEPVEIQFLKFELVSYWEKRGARGGGLWYFAPILAPSKAPLTIFTSLTIFYFFDYS